MDWEDGQQETFFLILLTEKYILFHLFSLLIEKEKSFLFFYVLAMKL